jgi:hypothetical protein
MKPQQLDSIKYLSCLGRICKASLLFMLAVLMAGCSSGFAMRKPDGSLIGLGTLDFSAGNSAGAVVLKMNESVYQGSWKSHKVDESSTIIKDYGINSRKYQAYSLGNGNYLWEGKASLHSYQGDILECEFTYRGIDGRGNCKSGSEKFDFIIAKPD